MMCNENHSLPEYLYIEHGQWSKIIY